MSSVDPSEPPYIYIHTGVVVVVVVGGGVVAMRVYSFFL
jgi:hypothetical protein